MPGNPIIAMVTRIKDIPEITAIVSTRVYKIDTVPTAPTLPYLLLPGTVSDIGDACTSSSDNSHARVQVSVFASSDTVAEYLSLLLKKKVPCEEPLILTAGLDPVSNIQQYLLTSSIEDAGAIPDVNTEAKVYIRHRDFRIAYAY